MRNGMLMCAVALLVLAEGALAADPAYYTKKDAWHGTLMAAREALAKVEADESKQPMQMPGRPKDEQWTPWHHVGPFVTGGQHAFNTAYPPEKDIDLTQPCGGMKWVSHPEWTDGVTHELQTPGESAPPTSIAP